MQKLIFSVTFQRCRYYDEANNEFSGCYESINGNDVTNICDNNNKVLVTLEGESEITLDLIPFSEYYYYCSDRVNYYFNNVSDASLIVQINDELITKEVRFNINAIDLDVIVENVNTSSDEINLKDYTIKFKTIRSKDPTKQLILHCWDPIKYEYPTISPNSFLYDVVYIDGCKLQLDEQLTRSLTFRTKSETININIIGIQGINYTYGVNQLKIEYPDKEKTITIIATSKSQVSIEADENSFITCEDDMSINDHFLLFLQSKSTNSISSLPTICGNWPKGSITEPYDKYVYSYISGKFFFSAYNLPIYDLGGDTEFVLTQKKSSIFMKEDEIKYNLTISTKDDIEASLYFEGEPFDLLYTHDIHWNTYDGYLTTTSSKITVYAKTKTGIRHNGPGQLVYTNKAEAEETFIVDFINLVKGGKIVNSYNFDFEDIYNKVKDLYDSYEQKIPKNATLNSHANNYINFAKEKINDLSDIINSASNKFSDLLNISMKIDPNNERNDKSTYIINRKDIPISYYYMNSVNKPQPILCFDETPTISDWIFKDASNMFYSFINKFYYDEDSEELRENLPKFASTSILGDFTLSEDKKCIEYKLKEVPSSTFEFFIYTTNETYIQILEKIEVITLLTSSDLDAASKLKSKNSRNIVIFVLNDIPEGKSINLNGIRKDSNVFVFGLNENKIEDIYEKVQNLMDLDDEYDYNPPGNWNSTEYDILRAQKHKKEVEILTSITKNYKDYQTKVSLRYNTVQTLALALVDYTGTYIRCAKFMTSLSTFSKINNFVSSITYTELASYKSISHLKLNDLVLLPFTIDPYERLGIEEINLTETQWSIKYFSYLEENDGYPDQQIIFYPIDQKNVTGKLYLYSGSYDYCAFNVPDDKEDQVLKGVSVAIDIFSYFSTHKIPGISILEDQEQNEKVHKKNKNANYFNIFKSFLKSSKTPRNSNKKAALLGNDESVFYFLGNWDKVKSIDHLSAMAGKYNPVYIAKLDETCNPEIGAKALNLNTNASFIKYLVDIDEKHFTEPEYIVRSKTIEFQSENTTVTFSDIIFKSDREFELKLAGKTSKITTEKLRVESYVNATVNSPIEITNLIEFGPYSTLTYDSLTAKDVVLKLNYQISGGIPSIPEGLTPKEIIFNYIGESKDPAELVDYSIYIGPTGNRIPFIGENHKTECESWRSKTKFESTYYPEFRAGSSTVSVTCIEKGDSSILTINLLKNAKGEKEEPIINAEPGPDGGDTGDDDYNTPSSTTGGDKPQIPTATPTATPSITTEDTSKKNNTVVGTITNTNNKTPEKIKEEIEEKFKNPDVPTNSKDDQVVSIETSSSQEIQFNDLDLQPNQYVKLGDEAKVKLSGGSLNLVLDKDSSSVSVSVRDASNVKLSIKNMDACTIKIGTQGTENSKVSITSNSEVYDHLTFDVDENVKSIEIESINLHDTGSISSNTPISVNNLEVQPQTSGKLNNVAVSKDMAISQTSVLELNDCDLSTAALNLNLHSYSSSYFDTPMLTGTLGDPPASISLAKPNDNTSPADDQELLLFQGTFKSSCDDWKNKIDYGETKFNDGTCRDINNLVTLEERKSLKVLYNTKLNDGDKGNKLSGGQIAGIVVGCVAFVAIIVVIVVVVVMKKRKKHQSSVESGNDNQDDL